MKTTSLKKKASRIPTSHGKIVRHEGSAFKLIVHPLGRFCLADAEEIGSGKLINLFDNKNPLAKILRQKVEDGLVS